MVRPPESLARYQLFEEGIQTIFPKNISKFYALYLFLDFYFCIIIIYRRERFEEIQNCKLYANKEIEIEMD